MRSTVLVGAILGVVSEYQVDGEWRQLDGRVPFDGEMSNRNRMIESLLRVCLQIHIRLARCVSRIIVGLAHWRRRLMTESAPTG